MKKVLIVTDLEGLKKYPAKNSLIVLGRSGSNFWMQNLEAIGGEVIPNAEANEVTIKFRLIDGQLLVMQDDPAMLPKQTFDSKSKKWVLA